jgi:hypothetical protein
MKATPAKGVKSMVRSMWTPTYRFCIGLMALGWISVTPARAVTCQEVRALSATELAYWAERLQVSPAYLAELLERAFCDLGSRHPPIAPDGKRQSMQSSRPSH